MQLQIFEIPKDEYGLDNLTTIEIGEAVWFVAREVCRALDLRDMPNALGRLEEDDKQVFAIPHKGNEIIISESGLYTLVFASRKPNARAFQRWITKEVIPSIRKSGSYGKSALPNFVTRFNDNWSNVDSGYFSVISELFIRLYGRFEQEGYQIPDKALNGKEIRPDVSVGRIFSNYLTVNYPHLSNKYKMYSHVFPNGSTFDCRQYENDLLPIFIKFVDEDWIPNRAAEYFKLRDPIALEYLPKLLGHG